MTVETAFQMDQIAPNARHGQTGGFANPDSELRAGGIVAGVFFIGLLGWAAMIPLDAAVVSSGVVSVAGNRQAVQHLDGGIVKAIHVKEGDFVNEGDVLLELIETDLRAEERSLSSQLIELEAQHARLRAEQDQIPRITPPERWQDLDDIDKRFAERVLRRQNSELVARTATDKAKRSIVKSKRDQLVSRLPGLEAEKRAASEQLLILKAEIDTLNDLFTKGLAELPRIRALEREAANLRGRIGDLESAVAEAQDAMQETTEQDRSITANRRESQAEDLRNVETRLSDVAPRYRAIAEKLGRTQLRATATGNVVGLNTFTVGGIIPPGGRVLDIVPSNRDLVIEATIAPEHGDDVQVSDPTEVRFPAINSRSPPTFAGKVEKVSADRMVEEQSGAAFFRIEISVPTTQRADTESLKTYEIRPGMPADVIIPLKKRTALQYIIDPITNSLWRSFREQ
ncbi:MAG: HlyD family type I secretion periplasmic adaptor subunit [Alphaproteobacteria bacterium]|nr:HlyD family type I secretion periplasmic adaptor subunit [Alphaproteobacteria bacterium]